MNVKYATYSQLFWLGLIMLLLPACDYVTPEDPPPPPAENTLMVYCDFTTSLNLESSAEIQKFGEWVLKHAPRPANIEFYEISRVAKASYLQARLEAKPDGLSGFDETIWEKEELANVEGYVNQLREEVDKLKGKYESDPDYRGANSCITNTLLQANKYLRPILAADSSHQAYLILISDMIEECENSVLGKMYMNTRSASAVPARFEAIHEQVETKDPVPTEFARVKPLILQVTQQDQKNPFSLYQSEFESLWQDIFLKLGFSEVAIKRWHFLPQPPPQQIWTH
ncbi:MAG: hypothetical protein AAF206_03495 [Bacteroidota bacterium]